MVFMAVGLFIAAFHFMRLRSDTQDHKTLQEAIRADSPIVPELLEQLRDRPRRRAQTTGLVLLALALAILGSGIIQGGEQNLRNSAAAAIFPAMLGIVIFWRSLLKKPGG
jgi:hypothetical protein